MSDRSAAAKALSFSFKSSKALGDTIITALISSTLVCVVSQYTTSCQKDICILFLAGRLALCVMTCSV